MLKKLTFTAVLLLILAIPNSVAHANTYMTAASKAVDHVVGFHKDGNIQANVAIEIKKIEVKKTIRVMATAYSPTPWQTDDSPCITATGHNLCEDTEKNIIAVSRDLLKTGTLRYHQQITLPDMFGDRIFYVEDTMNARFTNRIDVFHYSTKDAREFGFKRNVELQMI